MSAPGRPTPPSVPRWVRLAMKISMSSDELDEALGELGDLHAHWVQRFGAVEADRRHRREARRYPVQLLARGLRSVRPPDLRHAFATIARRVRSMARAPALSSAIVLTLGIGIGGSTALFAVADVLVLRPLPYADAERLVWIYTDNPPYRFSFSVVDLQALQKEQTSFERVAALRRTARTFTSSGASTDVAERLSIWEVTPGFFELLGISPLAGRAASPDEGGPDADGTVLVGAGFATSRLGVAASDLERAVGTTVELDDVPYRVIGVLPDRIGPMAAQTQVFVTQRLEPPTRRGPFSQIVLGKLARGVDRAAAEQELRAINARLFPLWRDSYQDEGATWATAPLTELLHGDSDRLIMLLAGSLGLLLVLATANAGTLLLSRVRSRGRELAVRVALGASRRRVLAELVLESSLYAAAGAAVAWPLARGVLAGLPGVASTYVPRLDEAVLGGRALAFAAMLAALATAFFVLVSSLQASATGATPELRWGSRSVTPGRREHRSQRFLVAAQVAIAVPLLFGAGLLASSLWRLERVDPGFDPSGLLTARVSLAEGRYADDESRQALWHALEERISGLPGVIAVGVSDGRPPLEAYNYNNFDLEARPTPPGESQPVANWVSADAGYLQALGAPLLEGRTLTRADETAAEAPVIVVDERWARLHFPGESAVGQRLREGGSTEGPWITVVGVVGEVPYAGLAGETGGTVYAPWTGLAEPFVVARVQGAPATLVGALRAELARLDPTAPLTEVETGESLMGASLREPRHLTLLLALFAVVAVVLAAVGLFGVTAHWVQNRRADIAVRLALGGTPPRVLRAAVADIVAICGVGLAVGAVVAPAFGRLLERSLYDVGRADPTILGAVVAFLGMVTLAACALPARRIVRASPGAMLRQE